MKIKLFILGLFIAAGTLFVSCSNDDNDSGKTNQAREQLLKSKYPKAENLTWKKSKDNKYDIASFTLPKSIRATAATKDVVDVWFGASDQMRLVNQEISFTELPEAVKTKFAKTNSIFADKKSYSDENVWAVDDVFRLERDGIVSYKLEMDAVNTIMEIDLYFDALGVLLKEVEDIDKEEDEAPLEIPANISKWVKDNYPKAEILDYEAETEGAATEHEIDLKNEKLIIEVELSETAGKLTVMEIELNYPTIDALPAAILAKLKEVVNAQTNFALTDITEVEMTVAENGSKIYNIEFDKAGNDSELDITETSAGLITAGTIESETEEEDAE